MGTFYGMSSLIEVGLERLVPYDFMLANIFPISLPLLFLIGSSCGFGRSSSTSALLTDFFFYKYRAKLIREKEIDKKEMYILQ